MDRENRDKNESREEESRWFGSQSLQVMADGKRDPAGGEATGLTLREAALTPAMLKKLIRLSADWEAEASCWGYRKNKAADIKGNRIFVLEKNNRIRGYLFGHVEQAKNSSSVMPDGTPFFEVEELYVKPAYRSRGYGAMLFAFAEEAVRDRADYIMLSTATKNWQAILHFYIEELDMSFWSARLFKRLK